MSRQYLRGLDLREIHIYDRDNDQGYQGEVDSVNARGNGDWATLTGKREIENYLHPNAIQAALGVEVSFGDNDDVALIVAQAVHEASDSPKPWAEVDEPGREKKASNAKRRLCREAAAKTTLLMLRERDADREVEGWFERVAAAVE